MKPPPSVLSWCLGAACTLRLVAPLVAQAPDQQPATRVPLPHPDIPPPVIPPEPTAWGILWLEVLAVVALLGLLAWLLFLRRTAPAKESVSAIKLALTQLDELKEKLSAMAPDEVAHRVSVILRAYLQSRYAVPAPFRTTEELYGSEVIEARLGLRERFGPIAELYDRIEFSPQPATREDCARLIDEAAHVLKDEKRYGAGALPPPLHPRPPQLPAAPNGA